MNHFQKRRLTLLRKIMILLKFKKKGLQNQKKVKSKDTLLSDRHSGSSEEERKEHEKKFKEIGEAYGVLSDAKERSRYNNGCDLDDLEGTTSGHGGFTAADLDPEQAFKVSQ